MSNYEKLKREYDSLISADAAAVAKIDVYKSRLKELGCDSVESAKQILSKLQSKCEKFRKKIDELSSDIEEVIENANSRD